MKTVECEIDPVRTVATGPLWVGQLAWVYNNIVVIELQLVDAPSEGERGGELLPFHVVLFPLQSVYMLQRVWTMMEGILYYVWVCQ